MNWPNPKTQKAKKPQGTSLACFINFNCNFFLSQVMTGNSVPEACSAFRPASEIHIRAIVRNYVNRLDQLRMVFREERVLAQSNEGAETSRERSQTGRSRAPETGYFSFTTAQHLAGSRHVSNQETGPDAGWTKSPFHEKVGSGVGESMALSSLIETARGSRAQNPFRDHLCACIRPCNVQENPSKPLA